MYNPLTFGTVVRLLRSMCLHCGKFKMAADRVAARPNSTTSLPLPIPPRLKRFSPSLAADVKPLKPFCLFL